MLFDKLTPDMIKSLIETLPGEITVIDANDEVAGWNKHDNRLFYRPMTSMGVNFRDCHPKKSLEMVEKLVAEMKEGKRDMARFWIDLPVKGDTEKHKILIEFYALRDEKKKYLGCMEYTMDVDHIKKLEGQKRLLD